jgi:dipeptidyl-peptidase-4
VIALALLLSFIPLYTLSQTKLTIEDIWSKYTFIGNSVEGFSSMRDGVHYSAIDEDANSYSNFLIYSFQTGKVSDTIALGKFLVPADSAKAIRPEDYKLSADKSKVLFTTASEKIYRHSSKSNYFISDVKTKKLTPLSAGGKQQDADFSPDGSKVGFVRDNNLFYKDLLSGKEFQVTRDGKKNAIINGLTDWVYEEEFGFTQAFQWSPDSKQIDFHACNLDKFQDQSLHAYLNGNT